MDHMVHVPREHDTALTKLGNTVYFCTFDQSGSRNFYCQYILDTFSVQNAVAVVLQKRLFKRCIDVLFQYNTDNGPDSSIKTPGYNETPVYLKRQMAKQMH